MPFRRIYPLSYPMREAAVLSPDRFRIEHKLRMRNLFLCKAYSS